MALTLFGFPPLLIGIWLMMRGRSVTLLVMMVGLSIMNGSAAIRLPALNNSSIQPIYFGMAMLLAQSLWNGRRGGVTLIGAAVTNAPVVVYCVYAALLAFIMPFVLAGQLAVTPLRPTVTGYLFATEPLGFTSQNITTSVYLLFTMLIVLCASIAFRNDRDIRLFVRAAAIIAMVQAVLGFGSVVANGTPLQAFFDFFRNGFYAQLDQNIGGIVRMNGISPEPSGYTFATLPWFLFNFEMWIRNVDRRWTGPAAGASGLALLMSTSSTAYLGFSALILLLGARTVIAPGAISFRKLALLAMLVAIALILVMLAMLAAPALVREMQDVLAFVTVEKANTSSGMQRSFWAKQGVDAFIASGGIGIGAGSFRSSSIATAILGSAGIVGTLAFLAQLAITLRPLRKSSYTPTGDLATDVGASAGWAAVTMIVPLCFTSPSCDPGAIWAMLSGTAVGLRGLAMQGPARRSWPPAEPAAPVTA